MANAKLITSRKLKIDKANSTIVAVLAVCSFVIVFSLIASKSLIATYTFKNKVATASQATIDKINTDQTAADNLIKSYNTFLNSSSNIIGGNPTGTGAQDGDNSSIIQDSLPIKYDFPALATSIQGLIGVPGVTINNITGTDTGSGGTSSSASASTSSSTSSNSTQAVAIPFSVEVEGPYSLIATVITRLQNSIRPIQIQTIDLKGDDSDLKVNITAQTYYLLASGLNIGSETIQ